MYPQMPFTENLPKIDLHGETRETADFLVQEFIRDCDKQGLKKVIIIHGIGTGILKKQVQETLKKNKSVEKFYVDFFNVGCTIVELK